MKKATLLLSADWHIRSDVPENRVDDFLGAQEKKIDFILDTSNRYDCPVLIAGDIGDKSKWENWLLEKYVKKFKAHCQRIYVLPGQHDLPNHRLDKLSESGLGVLAASLAIKLLVDPMIYIQGIENFPFPFGKKILKIEEYQNKKFGKSGNQNIAIIHQLVSQSKLWQGQENFISAKSLLKKFPCYNLIISGDNHQSFVEKYKGRLLINPGSIMRATISQFNHKPKIYLWKAEDNEVKAIEVPIQSPEKVFDLSAMKKQDKKNERMSAFVESLKSDCEFKMNFKDNLNVFLNKNKIEQGIEDKIFIALEKEK